jgi:glycosyltransferase involved in cell wall biosynthesis
VSINVSIVVATYNRAEILRDTLASLAAVDATGISYEVLVIDNNSSDHTRDVVMSFCDRLPIHYLREERQGKNFAVNTGVEFASGDLILFTDDDVNFGHAWVKRYWDAAQSQPDADYFGGNVISRFPEDAPRWVNYRYVDFSDLQLGDQDRPLSAEEQFLGANMAVRARLFAEGVRFDTTIGPSAKTVRKGSETSLLLQLKRTGHRGWFVAAADVEHRVDSHPWMFSRRYQLKRRFQTSRGNVYLGDADGYVGRRSVAGVPIWSALQLLKATALLGISWVTFWRYRQRIEAEGRLALWLGIVYESVLGSRRKQ